LPGQIEALEREQAEIGARLSQPDYHNGGVERIRADGERLNSLTAELERCYARWEELEARRGAS
ncbi:MAG: ABC transporter ATP-binding protein, partial [Gammaproteobacteria bacterium]|nr:ABC transporter ATP-binding protein [Gammaproteobacteria bacterium]